jgi:Peptidase inhibitor I78 family
MQVSRGGIALVFIATLTACTSAIRTAEVEDELGSGADACGAAEYTPMIGQQFTVLNDASLPENRRVLFPGAAVGEETDMTRLNITIGTDDRISQVYCG